MSEIRGIVRGTLPLHFIIYSFISGSVLIFFSPVRFWLSLPRFVTNPFLGVDASQVLQSFIVIFLFSLALGTPLFLVKRLIIGNGMLFAKVMACLGSIYRYFSKTPKEKPSAISYTLGLALEAERQKWLEEYGFLGYSDLMLAQAEIVNSLIVSGSSSFILWIIYYIMLLKANTETFALMMTSLVIFALAWAYNRWYFRKEMEETSISLKCTFISNMRLNGKLQECIIRDENKECPFGQKYCTAIDRSGLSLKATRGSPRSVT